MTADLPGVILYALPAAITGFLLAELFDRAVKPFLPARVRRVGARARTWYFHIPRRFTPDRIYKLWYRTGIMTEENYRAFQERGYISDDTDPEYLQRYEEARDG